MAPAVAAALISVVGALLVALVGVWQANRGLAHRSEARVSDPRLLEHRWRSYPELWTNMRSAAEAGNAGRLREVAGDFTDWYFRDGLAPSNESQKQWLRVTRSPCGGCYGRRLE
jgi:hypothetical protein